MLGRNVGLLQSYAPCDAPSVLIADARLDAFSVGEIAFARKA
jgi:hypothetical protein